MKPSHARKMAKIPKTEKELEQPECSGAAKMLDVNWCKVSENIVSSTIRCEHTYNSLLHISTSICQQKLIICSWKIS